MNLSEFDDWCSVGPRVFYGCWVRAQRLVTASENIHCVSMLRSVRASSDRAAVARIEVGKMSHQRNIHHKQENSDAPVIPKNVGEQTATVYAKSTSSLK